MKKNESHYIIEFYTVGNSVKVSAFDPESYTEVSIIGPRSSTEAALTAAAIKKLEYMLKKKSSKK